MRVEPGRTSLTARLDSLPGFAHDSLRQRHHRTPAEVWLRQLLDEGLRRAGDERELDVGPVLADRVVDDGPALEKRLPLRRQYQAVGALPDRNLADIADKQLALTAAAGRDRQGAEVLLGRRGDDVEVTSQFAAQAPIGDADAHRRVIARTAASRRCPTGSRTSAATRWRHRGFRSALRPRAGARSRPWHRP